MLANTPRRPGSSRTGGVLYGARMSDKVLLFVVSRQGGDSRRVAPDGFELSVRQWRLAK
jgi:hypothetical protein